MQRQLRKNPKVRIKLSKQEQEEKKYEEVSVAFWELARNKIRFNNQFI